MRITFLGFTVPQEEMDYILRTDPNMPIQTHKFAWSVVRSLVKNDIAVDLISTHPVTNFPHTKSILYSKKNIYEESVNGILLPFINTIGLKHVTRFLSCIIYGIPRIYSFKSDIILIHGVHSPFLYYGLLLKIILKKKIVIILTDPPSETYSTDTYISLKLKKIDKILIKKSLLYCDGVIALTERLAKDFAPHIPYLVIEGIFDESKTLDSIKNNENVNEENKENEKKVILYAGGLNESYGLGLLLKSFEKVSHKNVCLKIFGKGDFESRIATAAEKDSRIYFGGFCNNLEVLAHMQSADILINPRPSYQDFVKYSFPSKIIEYMSTGTPVLTTDLSGIPEDYKEYLYIMDDETEQGVEKSINKLLSMSKKELHLKGSAAKFFIKNFKTERKQGNKMLNFFLDIRNNGS